MIKQIEINKDKLILIKINSSTGEIHQEAVIVDYKYFPDVKMYNVIISEKEKEDEI
jgi:hypothetical protein